MSPRRPLRWVKFLVLAFLLLVSAGKGWPVVVLLGTLAESPYAEFSHPILVPLVAVACCAIGVVAILLDAAFDRLVPRPAIVGIVILAVTPWAPPSHSLEGGERAVRRAAHEVRLHATQSLRADGAIDAAPGRLFPSGHAFERSPYRSRLLRRVPIQVRIVPAAEGPVRAPRPGDGPGTIYLAIGAGGRVGWITWLVLEDGRLQVARRSGRQEVFAIVPDRAVERVSSLAGGLK